ncbi:MAG: SoxR reducing system RseC family protein, partial [Fimbriimonadaceae bacterium]|nr:SoxR reducing system RseC family protein [Alphaproteobacteria bacterium]
MKRQEFSTFAPHDDLIEAYAQVVEFAGNHSVLRAEQQSACGSCAAAKGCGVSSLSKVFAKNTLLFETKDIPEPRIGDWYLIGLPQKVVLKMAAATYLVPVFVMIVAAMIASAQGAGDGVVALSSLAG